MNKNYVDQFQIKEIDQNIPYIVKRANDENEHIPKQKSFTQTHHSDLEKYSQ